jgi:putative endonuclease
MIPRTILQRVMSFLGRPPDYRGSRGVGQRWERLARRRLEAEGYEILESNYRARGGEIDFVGRENGVICFIEVKGRSGPGFGLPGEAVTAEKERRIVLAAEQYLARSSAGKTDCRFDVVSILERNGAAQIEIVRGAFDAGPPR